MRTTPATEVQARRLANVAGYALDALFRARTKRPAWLTDERLVAIAEARSYVRKLLHLLRPNHA